MPGIKFKIALSGLTDFQPVVTELQEDIRLDLPIIATCSDNLVKKKSSFLKQRKVNCLIETSTLDSLQSKSEVEESQIKVNSKPSYLMSFPVCKFYNLNQTCRFGKHCRYSHSTSQRPPPSLQNQEIDHDEEELNLPAQSHSSTPISDQKNVSVNTEPAALVDKNSSQVAVGNQDAISSIKKADNQVHQDLCYYFVRYGNCRYGEDCKFSHQLPNTNPSFGPKHRNSYRPRQNTTGAELPPRFRKTREARDGNSSRDAEQIESHNLISQEQTQDNVKKQVPNNLPKMAQRDEFRQGYKPQQKICPFFKSGRCNRNDRCQFLHLPKEKENATEFSEVNSKETEKISERKIEDHNLGPEENQGQRSNYNNKAPARQPMGLKQMFTYVELEEIGLEVIRDSEINAIKKRFPRDKIAVITEQEGKFCARIQFSPTDPDWPYDIKDFDLLFTVPGDYPKQMLSVQLPTDQDLPETVRRYVEVSLKEWLDHKAEQLARFEKTELIFRPFLRWLDRNIEDIVTEALKQLKRDLTARAAGLEFISASQLQAKFGAKSDSSSGQDDKNHSDNEGGEDENDGDSTEDSANTEEDSSDEEVTGYVELDLSPNREGTEMTLQQLQLRENAAALMFERLAVVIQCGRCKNHADLSVPRDRAMSVFCGKCTQIQYVTYRPALIHEFSFTIGYLDLEGCQAFDLILQDCQATSTCMACSKQTRIGGLVSGQMVDGWCKACNAKFRLATEGVKFTQIVQPGINTSVSKVAHVATAKAKKPPKDPAIKEGCPLPAFGTCKHYKQSYRWFRFPCCGKVYPCDICHDRKEDHEMQMATRMICGHCCKEQNFASDRPCNACGQHLSKIRTAHWEGGSGCRDKIAMSKNDQQKYKNMNKTLSNHKKKVQDGKSNKKTTKLRHV